MSISDKRPNLSIIIPHYNSPDYLRSLLETIGFHKDVEVIVIDDHSNEKKAQYQECKEEYSRLAGFTFLQNDPDKKGAGSARNVGLMHATGRWLIFADADDLFLQSMYEEVSRFFDSQYDIIYFPPYIDRQNKVRDVVKNYKAMCEAYRSGIKGAETRLRYGFIVPWSKMVNADFIKNNQIMFEDVEYSNDVMFSTKSGNKAKSITVCSKPIYYSTLTDGSLVKTKTEQAFFIRAKVNCEYFAYIKDCASEEEKRYLSTIAPLRTYYCIVKNGYGIQGVRKYRKLLKTYRLSIVQLRGAIETYRLKKKIKSFESI